MKYVRASFFALLFALLHATPVAALTCLIRVDGVEKSVLKITDADGAGTRLVVTWNNLFRLGPDGKLVQVPGGDEAVMSGVGTITDADGAGTRLVGAVNGLFRLNPDGKLVQVPGGEKAVTVGVDTITDADEAGTRLVRADNGLFQIRNRPKLQASGEALNNGKTLRFAFAGEQECKSHATRDDFILQDEHGKLIPTGDSSYDRQTGTLNFDLKEPPALGVRLSVSLATTDGAGKVYTISDPVIIEQPMTWQALAKRIAVGATVLHTLL